MCNMRQQVRPSGPTLQAAGLLVQSSLVWTRGFVWPFAHATQPEPAPRAIRRQARTKGPFLTNRIRLLLILSVLVTSGLEVPAQTPATGRLMRVKLAHSQKILEAILTSDFALLEQESHALGQMTKSPAWSVFHSPEYTRQSSAFLRAIDDLRDAAKGTDLDGAASSYVSLTLTCFQCHRFMKNKRIATR
jgi:hypothetical protein